MAEDECMKRMVEIIADSVRANAMPAAVLWSVAIILAAEPTGDSGTVPVPKGG